ncbi:MAG: hypothetical protein ABJI45_10305 [Paracoccaceae bacterium]
MNPAGKTPLSEANITIEKVIESGVLGSSERRATLLKYLVDKEISGRGEEIKAFSIALDVLGRDASFDPNTDSIVRSEMGRLRDALRLYKAEYAEPKDVCVEIPKGTYRPVFSAPVPDSPPSPVRFLRPAAISGLVLGIVLLVMVGFGLRPAEQETREQTFTPMYSGLPYEVVRIAVSIPEVHGEHPSAKKIAIGLNAELIMDLSAYPWLSIISPVGGFADIDPGDVDYVLDGDIFWGDDTLESQTRLVTYPQEELVWTNSQTVALNATAVRDTIVDIASLIAFKLASTGGLAPELAKVKNAHNSPENLDAYLCYLGVHLYLSAPTDEKHLELRNCLLQAVEDFPDFGDGWAALAMLHIDEARFNSNPRAGAKPWEDADMAVQKSLEHAPLRMPTLNVALINSIEAPNSDLDEFNRVSDLLLNLFPKHPSTLYNVGSRAAEFLGHWVDGLALVDQAIDLSPAPPSTFYLTRAYKVAMDGSDEEALASVHPLVSSASVSQLILNYLAAARNNLPGAMQSYQASLQDRGLTTHEDLMAHVKDRRYDKKLEAALLEQLELANAKAPSQ